MDVQDIVETEVPVGKYAPAGWIRTAKPIQEPLLHRGRRSRNLNSLRLRASDDQPQRERQFGK